MARKVDGFTSNKGRKERESVCERESEREIEKVTSGHGGGGWFELKL